jgi:TRAP-type uncharacterized transport system substrate-binding protein
VKDFQPFCGIAMAYSLPTLCLAVLLGCAMAAPADAQPQMDGSRITSIPRARTPAKPKSEVLKEKLNAWTVGMAGGLLEGAPIRFATEIARVVDDGDNLHVLPIVTRGPVENIEALLYLRGVDAAIINADALAQFRSLVPDIQRRITYILNLFPSELHVVAGPGINSLADLNGKKVNFNTPGTAAAYSGPLIFDKLGLEVDKTFIPHQVALEKLKSSEIAALVFVTSKPVDMLTRAKWEADYKLLPVPYEKLEEFYLPSTLTSADYPQLIAPDKAVDTIAVPTILAAFNWPKRTDRYERVARLTYYLFDRIGQLQQPGFHPKWKDINPSASVPGLARFPAAQDWLDRSTSAAQAGPAVEPARARELARSAAPNNKAEEERLFRQFMDWQRRGR